MDKQNYFNEIAEAIENGNYRNISYCEHNGVMGIRVVLSKDEFFYIGQDGNILVRILGNVSTFPLDFGSLKHLIDADFEEQRASKMEKWQQQMAVLQAKIDGNAQGAHYQLKGNAQEEPENKPWYKRFFRK